MTIGCTHWTRMKMLLCIGACVAISVGFVALATATSAMAGTCYGSSCTGLNPNLTSCVNDAKSIGAMDVKGSGMLQLRWSRSCNASWGRFSVYTRGGYDIKYARVTAWNPGKPSQGVAGQQIDWTGQATWWSGMVTGTTVSCTGVELFFGGTNRSLGWTWGPCVA